MALEGTAAAGVDARDTDLSVFHRYANFDRHVEGKFTKVRKLIKSIHGTVYMCKWERPGRPDTEAVVKLMPTEAVEMNAGRETCELCAHLAEHGVAPGGRFPPCTHERIPHQEDAKNEIGVITYLSKQTDCPRYILRMIDSFYENDRRDTWLVTEYADGGEFFEQVSSGRIEPKEDRNCRYMWQLLQAVRYLHHHCIGHRDISLENILITFRRDPPGTDPPLGEFRLMDFGGACMTRHGADQPLLRYFRPVGKAYYRPPECTIPAAIETQVVAPNNAVAGSTVFAKLLAPSHRGYVCEVILPPEVVPGRACMAELAGYTVPSMDTFACGVCLFIMSWGIPPWGAAKLADQLFCFIAGKGDQGIPLLLQQWRKPLLSPLAMELLIKMLRPTPSARPSIEQCLASDWFRSFENETVPVHERLDHQNATG